MNETAQSPLSPNLTDTAGQFAQPELARAKLRVAAEPEEHRPSGSHNTRVEILVDGEPVAQLFVTKWQVGWDGADAGVVNKVTLEFLAGDVEVDTLG